MRISAVRHKRESLVNRRLSGADLLGWLGRGKGANLENVRSGKADERLSIAVVEPKGRLEQGARRLCVLDRGGAGSKSLGRAG